MIPLAALTLSSPDTHIITHLLSHPVFARLEHASCLEEHLTSAALTRSRSGSGMKKLELYTENKDVSAEN
ncbi:unnamed protein product [Pleuronectes platessa]|uniref:Uncharacterized protein n=1 Tax=Pleuronectes platessa TaxID=8262 RepID=A0A9N7U3B4_PLEPL|nr:unnamed protein product [Pleuronectes platessa]